MDKQILKKSDEELQEYLQFRRRGWWINNKKGKGSYKRSDFKDKKNFEEGTKIVYEGD